MMSIATPIPKILLVESEAAVANSIQATLGDSHSGLFDVEWVRHLSDALARLRDKGIAAVLLNLFLPDSQGMETFDKLHGLASDIPILVLGGDDDEALAKQAVARGAQDYLLPEHLNGYSLHRALRNAIERKIIEDALYVEKETAQVTLNSIGDAVLCTAMSGNVTYLNRVAESMTGWSREEASGRPLAEVFQIVDAVTRKVLRDPMEMAVAQNGTVGLPANCILIRRDGFEFAIEDSAAPIRDRAGRVTGAVIVFHDVTATRNLSLQMAHSAQHDCLTDLPNRLMLNDRISQSISLAYRQKKNIAVLFLDLDRFKYINDSLGHAVGDKLLQSVSKRLQASVRSSDTVSRQGGDEFVILLAEITNREDVAISARKILQSLSLPHLIEGHDLDIDGSIGISVYPQDGEDAETLIKNADTAMYHAKEKGRNNFQVFRAEMNLKVVQRQSIEGRLRRAMERKEFLLHYQPKVSLLTGKIIGAEALIRWQQPDRALIPPAQFVPIAEDCGLILQIGRWVLREVCTQARAWQAAGLPPLPVAVNVSAVEFRDKDFVECVRATLRETGLDARCLELELTESVLMEHGDSTTSLLQALKLMGVRLALDDFGTGYSSLTYLREFPIDVLKIDQSFVCQMTANPDDATIVVAAIGMAKNLKLRVIAEGVETPEQLAFLQGQQCAEAQGNFFSRPLAAAPFANLLQRGLPPALLCRPERLVPIAV